MFGTSLLSLVAICVAIAAATNNYGSDNYYQNYYNGYLEVFCGKGEALFKVVSEHHDKFQDRRWRWECRQLPIFTEYEECSWYKYINKFDAVILFQCPVNHYLAGVKSYHKNAYQDRVWSVKCCEMAGVCSRSCELSPFLNKYDTKISYYAQDAYAFTGLFSYQNNYYEDRRWKISQCDFGPCPVYGEKKPAHHDH